MIRSPLCCSLLALAVAVLVAQTAKADIPPQPRDIPAGKSSRPLIVRVDPTKDVSFLKIPKELLKAEEKAPEPKQSGWAPRRTQSIVAALAASIGVASVFLLRGKRSTKIVVLFVTGVVATGAIAEAWWVPPPVKPAPLVPPNFSGEVVIEATDGYQVELIIGTKPLPKRTGRPGPPPELSKEKAT